jgi:surfactin family lipopeptide synthetase A
MDDRQTGTALPALLCKGRYALLHCCEVSHIACFQVLLHKYTAQEDIVVGTPYANRDMAEVHDLMGPFLNTLALRLDLAGDPTFSAVVARAKAAATQAFAHGNAPFAKVVDSLGVIRSAAFTPVYQVRHTVPDAAL